MRRWRLLVLAGLVLLVAVGAWGVRERREWNRKLARSRLIDSEHFIRIERGMSQAEVEAILGGPPGDFRTAEVFNFGATPSEPVGRRETWSGNEGEIDVDFGEDGVIFSAFTVTMPVTPLSLRERVRDWLEQYWPLTGCNAILLAETH
jgi:hypothetical protein